jgi:hypothetical protein
MSQQQLSRAIHAVESGLNRAHQKKRHRTLMIVGESPRVFGVYLDAQPGNREGLVEDGR